MIHTIQLIHHQNFLDVRKQSAGLRHPLRGLLSIRQMPNSSHCYKALATPFSMAYAIWKCPPGPWCPRTLLSCSLRICGFELFYLHIANLQKCGTHLLVDYLFKIVALEAQNTFVESQRLLDAPYGNTNMLNLVNFHSGGMYYVGLEIFKTYARRDIYYTISEVDGILETIVLAVLEHR